MQTRSVFLAILAVGLFVMSARNVVDPDIWWHLRTGQMIVQTHTIPHVDPYSFPHSGDPWVDHEWLSQIIIFGIYRFGGFNGLILAFPLLIAVALGMLFVRCPGKPFIAGLCAVCGALASAPSWGVRPQMFTFLLASLLLWALEQSYERPGLLWWIVPLMLLWVNLHAGYALGIVFLLLFLVGNFLDAALRPAEGVRLWSHSKRLIVVFGLCVLVVPLNPNGFRMYRYPLETLQSSAMQEYISEWASPNFHQAEYAATLVLILAIVLFGALSPRRLRPRELLLLSVMAYAALRSVRHIPVFVLVAAPILAALIQSWLGEKHASWLAPSTTLTPAKLGLNGVLLVAFLFFAAFRIVYVLRNQEHAAKEKYPADAVARLLSDPAQGPVLNDYNWGGYLIWKAYPTYRVFIDGRADVYGDTFMNAFAATYYVRGGDWQASLEKWRIHSVLLPPDAPLVTALQDLPGWKNTYRDSQGVILTKTP